MQTNNNIAEDTTDLPVIVEKRLSVLIRWYMTNPTKLLAQAVVKQLEVLLKHPDCIGYPHERCSYKKMLLHWRALS